MIPYFQEHSLPLYWYFLAWAIPVFLYAAWWDVIARRVPNWLWIIAGFPIPAAFLIRDYMWDVLLFPILVAFVLVLRARGAWGMGDAKGTIWLALLVGALPAAAALLIASLGAWYAGRNGDRNVPFMMHYALGLIVTTLFLAAFL